MVKYVTTPMQTNMIGDRTINKAIPTPARNHLYGTYNSIVPSTSKIMKVNRLHGESPRKISVAVTNITLHHFSVVCQLATIAFNHDGTTEAMETITADRDCSSKSFRFFAYKYNNNKHIIDK